MKKIICLIMLTMIFIVSCGKEEEFVIEEIDVQIDGVGEHTFVYLSDLHIAVMSDEVDAAKVSEVEGRIVYSTTTDGVTAADLWPKLMKKVNSYNPDAVLLGGDMTDFSSKANMDALKVGLQEIKSGMYIRADHDYASWFTDYNDEHGRELQDEVYKILDIHEIEYDDLIIVGIDNSTSNVSSLTVEAFKDILKKGKPVIVMMHVPIKPNDDESLSVLSKKEFADRELIWGKDCYYYPDENTNELISIIKDENSLVKLVISGHLHFSWDGEISSGTRQHVFDAAFKRNIGLIKVHG